MWTDIDYMDGRAVFTNDPERFPIWKMRQLIDYLHDHQQKYTVMVDPAIKWEDSEIVQRGQDLDVFLRRDNGSEYVFRLVACLLKSRFNSWVPVPRDWEHCFARKLTDIFF